MPRFKSVSRTVNSVKLLKGDEIHIKKMVQEFRMTDKRFETNSAAIRYYVNVGIASERTTETVRDGLKDKIVRQNQKDAVRDELKPLANNIKELKELVSERFKESEESFASLSRNTDRIESKLDHGNEGILTVFKLVENALRNVIVLRSIFYVFLLGHKMGRIEPGEENLSRWSNIVTAAHRRANVLSLQEINSLSAEKLEADVVLKMSTDIFSQINSLPKPKDE
jgi:nucleoside-triphosphatase THEP1